jgi:hypothetical protein
MARPALKEVAAARCEATDMPRKWHIVSKNLAELLCGASMLHVGILDS